MTDRLLISVGCTWRKHPHRLHTLRVAPAIGEGIELIGGPWTTGARAKDETDGHTAWAPEPPASARVASLGASRASGPGVAEVRWVVDGAAPDDVVAITAFTLTAVSHPDGFNVAGLGTGVEATEEGWEAWVRIEAGKVPERPEPFTHIEIEATAEVAVIAGDGIRVEHVEATTRTKAGFRPNHPAVTIPLPSGTPIGLAGWSWSVANTPKRRGRYLRGFRFELVGEDLQVWVSNRGEVTRPSDLRLAADVVLAGP